jgi:hypothetical protein
MFTGFVDIEMTAPATRGYGWVKRKSWLTKKFAPKQVFCDFRDLLGGGRPFPSYLGGCW